MYSRSCSSTMDRVLLMRLLKVQLTQCRFYFIITCIAHIILVNHELTFSVSNRYRFLNTSSWIKWLTHVWTPSWQHMVSNDWPEISLSHPVISMLYFFEVSDKYVPLNLSSLVKEEVRWLWKQKSRTCVAMVMVSMLTIQQQILGSYRVAYSEYIVWNNQHKHQAKASVDFEMSMWTLKTTSSVVVVSLTSWGCSHWGCIKYLCIIDVVFTRERSKLLINQAKVLGTLFD